MSVTRPAASDPRGRRLLPLALLRMLPHARRADVVVSGRDVGWGPLLGRTAAVAAGTPHRLLVLGEGVDRRSLEHLAAGLGITRSVHLPGFHPDPLPTVAAADLFVLPGRWEGMGMSLAEALLLGTPVVAADCVAGPRRRPWQR